ncbi:MAG: membrane protein containing APHP domain protein [Candidatus Syntrophoarchaeum caldarius]|uniref:Membrane protein containing APHP domain protein n=1 Tax=Candidatus Syntropharchaeum caldarium TaxID=1838285 RepID=A0A1F2PBV6_9EURY|nr:MAG: membrane protein containing APHP domain protein [Candidatus Syntrophoarchaeum caldarius]
MVKCVRRLIAVFLISLFIFPLVSADLRKDLTDNLPLSVRSPSGTETLICGYLFERGSTGSVRITNLNTSLSWDARLLESEPDFYYLYLDEIELKAGDMLRLNATSGDESVVLIHTVNQSEIDEHLVWLDIIEDLAITEITIPNRITKDINTTIHAVIENIGLIPVVVPFNITFSVDGELITTTSFTEVPLNASENFTVEFYWTPLESGIHNITITVDPNHEIISETNESNNRMKKSVSVAELPSFYVPLDFPTIQDAVDNVTINGTTIYVASGTYNENIMIQKQITLLGADMNDTIIDGGGNDTLRLFANNCVIRGFSIINGSTGIKIESNGNKIFENWIYNNSCGVNITGLNNTVYHNNLNNVQNGFDTGNSSWDDGREGNYWSDCTGDDFDLNGIVDTPYECGWVTDRYPLVSPYVLHRDPAIAYLTVPTSIYVNETNTIFVGIANYGTSEVASNLSLKLGGTILNMTISLPYKSINAVYFCVTPNQMGTINLTAEIEACNEDSNRANNRMSVNVTVIPSPFKRLYNFDNETTMAEYYKYQLPESRTNALDYLAMQQNSDGGIGQGGYSTDLAIIAVSSAGENPQEFARLNSSLTDYLKAHPPQHDLTLISRYVLAIIASGENPRDFGGKNYLAMIQSFFDGEQFGIEKNIVDDAWAVLALTGAGYGNDTEIMRTERNYILRCQNESDGGWPYFENGTSSIDVTAIALEALVASGIAVDNSSIQNGTKYLEKNLVKNQWEEGMGQTDPLPESNLKNYAHSVQAIVAVGGNPIDGSWDYSQSAATYYGIENPYNPLLLLLGLEEKSGDFEGGFAFTFKDSYPEPKWTSMALPSLFAKPYPSMCTYSRVLSDIKPIHIGTRACYTNVTNIINATIKNNGGIFNVSLLVDGAEVDRARIVETNSTALSRVEFRWLPEKEGEYNLTVVADSENSIEENNESNNCIGRVVTVTKPDLHPRTELPAFYVNVTNRIETEVLGYGEGFNVSLLINGSVVDKAENISSYGFNKTTLYWKPNQTGNYTLRLIADSENDVFESDEKNNTIEENVSVILPDLYPQNISTMILYTDTENIIDVSINGSAEGFNATLFANGTIADKIENISSYNVANISFSWNPLLAGVYNLTVMVDADDEIEETNETNNNLSRIVTVENREAPYIKLLAPIGGECWSGVQTIKWSATDPNGDELIINISYSPDAGIMWHPIASNLENTGYYNWSTEYMLDGYDYKVKVEAFDGNSTSVDISKDVFTIYNRRSYEGAPSFHYNAGFSLSEAPNTNKTAWITEDIGACPSTSLIVADGKVFVYCYDSVKALDELNGSTDLNGSTKPIWSTSIDKAVYGSWATAAYYDGSVFIASGNHVYRISAKDGKIEWRFQFPDGGCSVNSGPCVAYGNVYVGSWNGGHYYCLNDSTGEIKWQFPPKGEKKLDHAQSTPAAHNGMVFFGDFTGGPKSKVFAVDGLTGEEIWNQTVSWSVCGSVTIAHNKVYLMTYNFYGSGEFYALNENNGSIVWQHTIARSDSTPAHAYGNIYVCGGCPGYERCRTYCLNDADGGNETWNVPDWGIWTYSPMVADKKVFIGKAEGPGMDSMLPAGMSARNAFTGEEIWRSDLGGGSPAIVHGRVYTVGGVNATGRVICFGSTNQPDLELSNLTTVPKSDIYVGQNVSINVTLRNIGSGNASAFNVSLRVNGEIEAEKRIDDGLNVNVSMPVNFSWTPVEAGEYLIIVEADSDHEITEQVSMPDNNKVSRPLTVKEWLDLAVEDIDYYPTEVHVGDIVNITPSITAVNLEGESVGVEFKVDDESKETKRGVVNGEQITVNFTWNASSPGGYNLTIVADPGGGIDEVNETNNETTIVVEVMPTPTPTSTPTPGLPHGYGGGGGGGSGIFDWGEFFGSGTGSEGNETGEFTIPINETESVIEEDSSRVNGYPMGEETGGSAGGGGKISYIWILIVTLTLALVIYGYWRESRFIGRRRRR